MFYHKTNILLTPIEYLKGVGPQKGEILRKELAIHTFYDMLFIFPFRYIDRSNLHKIKDIEQDGSMVQLLGRIVFSEDVGEGRAKRLVAHFKDVTGSIELVWFRASSMIEKMVSLGGDFLVYGKATKFNGVWNISHPELEKIEAGTLSQLPAFQPVYPSTEKLRQRWLSGKNYVQLVKSLFDLISIKHMEEILPDHIVKEHQLLGRFEALKAIHFPENQTEIERATHRLKFEELFIHQIGICKLKLNHTLVQGFAFHKVGDYFNKFYKEYLPFELTEDQKTVFV